MKNYVPHFIEANWRVGNFAGSFRCAVLFMDISGFTHLTETAFVLSERGAEIISHQLRRIFDPSVKAVLDRGGIITGFAGDAFTALFPDDDGSHAYSAASDVVRFFAEHGREEDPNGVFDFKVSCGIDFGEVNWAICRAPNGQCEFYFRGGAIEGAINARREAAPGEIRVSRSVPVTARWELSPCQPAECQPTAPETLDAFIQNEILVLGDKAEIKPIVSVFIGFGRAASDAAAASQPSAIESHAEISEIVGIVRDAVVSCDGTYNKLGFWDKGMAVLCLFGAPKATEKPARSALRFAELLRARLHEKLPHVHFRAGLDSGLAYSGTTGGVFRNEWTCLGDCVNLSARLMESAKWSEILISARVHEAADDYFERIALEERSFKGKAKPEVVYRFERALSQTMRRTREGAMIGRESELGRLYESFKPATEGRFAGMVYVYGDAGMGKTRLAAEFRGMGILPMTIHGLEARATSRWGAAQLAAAVRWVHLPCFENDSGLKPISRWLEEFFEVNAFTTEEEKRRKVGQRIDGIVRGGASPLETRNELARAASFLAALVNCHWDGSLYSQVQDPKLRYENQLYAVKELVKALAREAPLVVEVEDSHWLDTSSAEWLNVMTRNVADVPLLFLFTSRYNDDGSKPRVRVGEDVPVREIELQTFDEPLCSAMFVRRVGRKPSPALAEFLAERTGGNPFFVEQMILHLQEGALLAESPEGMALAGELGRLPTSLDSLLLARIDRLEANLRDGLKHAAIVGARFLRRVLEEFLRGSGEFSGAPESVVPDAQRQHLIVPARLSETSGTGVPSVSGHGQDAHPTGIGAEAAYVFRHVLMQKAAYHLYPPTLRTRLHGIAAQTIERLFPDSKEFHRELAEHFAKAEMPLKELEHLEKAAQYAGDNFKNVEAINLYARLISRLNDCAGLPDSSTQLRVAKACYALAGLYRLVGKWTEAIQTYEKTSRLAEEVKDAKLLVDSQTGLCWIGRLRGKMDEAVAVGLSAARVAESAGYTMGKARAIGQVGIVHVNRRNYERALECFREQIELAETAGDRRSQAAGIGNMGNTYLYQGEYNLAMECFQKCLRVAEEMDDKDLLATTIGNIGIIYKNQGEYARALESYRKHMELADELGDRLKKGIVLGNMAALCLEQGDHTRAMEYFQQRLRLAEQAGHKAGEARALLGIGTVHETQRDYERAAQCLRRCMEVADSIGDKVTRSDAMTEMGTVCQCQGDSRRATEYFEQALQLAEQTGSRESKAQALTGIGIMLAGAGRCAEAVEKLNVTIAVWRELNTRPRMTEPLIAVAKAYAGLGDHEAARNALRQARELAEQFKQAALMKEIEKID